VAADLRVGLEREGDDGDETEREPFPALVYATGAEEQLAADLQVVQAKSK
jgi:hypothetical protein